MNILKIKQLSIAVALLLISLSSSFVKAQIKSDVPINLKHYKLVWHDEFNGNKVDTTKWSYRSNGTHRGFAEVDGPKTISLDDKGHAIIQVIQQNNRYYVGQLSTHNHFNPVYGYFECRAKMNHSIGAHIAFWLQSPAISDTPINNTRKNGSEIDIFEYHRKSPDTIWQTVHINGYGASHKAESKQIKIAHIDSGFHTFGLLWTKDAYTFYVDGVITSTTSFGISNRPEYIILSTELTGFGGDPTQGKYPDSVVYDYVRVYQAK